MKVKKCGHHSHEGERVLPITEFHKDKHAADGLKSMCKICSRRKARKWRAKKSKDPEWRKKFNDNNTKYRKNGGKVLQLFLAAQDRARKKGLDFNITKDDIIIPKMCPILGIPIEAGNGRRCDVPKKDIMLVGAKNSSPSIDRIDNSKGYVKGNIRVISWRANYLKNNATLNELILLGEDAKHQQQILSE